MLILKKKKKATKLKKKNKQNQSLKNPPATKIFYRHLLSRVTPKGKAKHIHILHKNTQAGKRGTDVPNKDPQQRAWPGMGKQGWCRFTGTSEMSSWQASKHRKHRRMHNCDHPELHLLRTCFETTIISCLNTVYHTRLHMSL